MLHIYSGEGKGKTTCAMGLALRWVGNGGTVAVAQFLKSSNSGERRMLEQMDGVILLPVPETVKFLWEMTGGEKVAAAAEMTALFQQAAGLVRRRECDMLVLDELCGAISGGMVSMDTVVDFLEERHPVEIVITGRDPGRELTGRADYWTQMEKGRHPYDRGMPARKGVEW